MRIASIGGKIKELERMKSGYTLLDAHGVTMTKWRNLCCTLPGGFGTASYDSYAKLLFEDDGKLYLTWDYGLLIAWDDDKKTWSTHPESARK